MQKISGIIIFMVLYLYLICGFVSYIQKAIDIKTEQIWSFDNTNNGMWDSAMKIRITINRIKDFNQVNLNLINKSLGSVENTEW